MASVQNYYLNKSHALKLEADIGAPPPNASGPVPQTNMEFNSQVAQPPSPTDDTVNN